MPHEIGYVDNSLGSFANRRLIEKIKTVALLGGWTVLREVAHADGGLTELILKSLGYSGDEEIFVGFYSYESVSSDYYNIAACVMQGYVPENAITAQPGVQISGVPTHNQRIDYWLTVTPGRIVAGVKVGTPVYGGFYVGKYLSYARPNQYPSPLVCAGMLAGAAATRFSDTSYQMPYVGNRANMRMRNPTAWVQPYCYPYSNSYLAGTASYLRDTNGNYSLLPIELHDSAANLWGCLEGVLYISGFNNVVENTLVIDGKTYVVMQDVYRTGFNNYYALRMDD